MQSCSRFPIRGMRRFAWRSSKTLAYFGSRRPMYRRLRHGWHSWPPINRSHRHCALKPPEFCRAGTTIQVLPCVLRCRLIRIPRHNDLTYIDSPFASCSLSPGYSSCGCSCNQLRSRTESFPEDDRSSAACNASNAQSPRVAHPANRRGGDSFQTRWLSGADS
jgi:hypothetical protein